MALRWRAGLVLGIALVMAACGGSATPSGAAPSDEAPAPSGDVTIVDFAFQPGELSVAAGGTVTWSNTGSQPHSATSTVSESNPTKFDSGILNPGQSYSYTFEKPGTSTTRTRSPYLSPKKASAP